MSQNNASQNAPSKKGHWFRGIRPKPSRSEGNKGSANGNAKAEEQNSPPSVGDPELDAAIGEFVFRYKRFAKANASLVGEVDVDRLLAAIKSANSEKNIRNSARLFEDRVGDVIKITKEKRRIYDAKWTGKVVNFLAKMYPLTRTSLSLTSAIAAVPCMSYH